MKNLTLAVTFAIAAFAPAAAFADGPGRHPAYLHAIQDLRHARALLERPAGLQVKWDEKIAIREIDAALHEIKEAAIDDGKPLGEHPAIDVNLAWGGRLHKALDLLSQAHADADQEEDNGFARGLKRRALQHIDSAAQFVKDGIVDAEQAPPPPPPAQHPAYLHAIEDLRYARALLERPARVAVKWDEQIAVREIDGALREIKEAAIDDGKQLGEHPPIDTNLDYGGRLQKADELLQQARADVDQRESNEFARGLKRRAIQRIDAAHAAVLQGIANARPPEPAAHPAYLHALQDLRAARALLARPTHRGDVKWDEHAAMREIEAGMKEIRDAAIDDGKDLEDHPPVDAETPWAGRLTKALELVDGAIRDIHQREDDGYAHGLRNRALGHLNRARGFIRQGIDDRNMR